MQHYNAGAVIRAILALGNLLFCCSAHGQQRSDPEVLTCGTVTNARIGQAGVKYTGTVSNDDYRLEVTIPGGLTGLGANPHAPFHGFTIFLNESACIAFEIEHIVPLSDEVPRADGRGQRRIKVGGRDAIEESRIGAVLGTKYVNVQVHLELDRQGYQNGLWIYLITPFEQRGAAERVFQSFLASFRFW